ncbi:thiosulfate/3-mercaptopyruvate sulfurtransferase [Desulfuromusa kysingii]|uniref:Thiosulfate/3-mercaptopyruvate sulfurtransferase n=1 Tax=Desulfuromusa kysingii TaxID=37625 RepID=A0A1H3ZU92_9BACT|nr:sulfurtransferase [Desulfuromusa kysingii]SEA27248.1 thiosulfate/3-mercaptopyruvate sulfurtransferase [Desulfuromusa kysingii]
MLRIITPVWLILFVVLTLCSPVFAIELVDSSWVAENIHKAKTIIVDVQSQSDYYAIAHLPGAVKVNRHADLSDYTQEPPTLYPSPEQFKQVLDRLGIENDSTVIAYDDKFGLFASRFLVIMEMYGHDTQQLMLLDGGIDNWEQEGREESTASVQLPASDYTIVDNRAGIRLAWSDIYRDKLAKNLDAIILLDVRPENEYLGQKIRGIRGGHIPGAINITGTKANDSETQKFLSLKEIATLYADNGITAESPVYLYCHSGDRAAHAYMQLRYLLGYKNVRIYDGGWNAWSSKLFLPAQDTHWLWEQ